LTREDLEPCLPIDGFLSFSEITHEAAMEVLELAPFGFGNPSPVFGVRNVEVSGPAEAWNDKHLNVRLRQNGRGLKIKAWNFGARAAEFTPGATLDAAICFEADKYSAARGYAPWCVELRDVRPASGESAYGIGRPAPGSW
jgi:single-stranded-DNA-specific exonuclease